MFQSGSIGQGADVVGFYEGTSAANINHGSAVPGQPFINGADACGGNCAQQRSDTDDVDDSFHVIHLPGAQRSRKS
jgi:hypothetical protein